MSTGLGDAKVEVGRTGPESTGRLEVLALLPSICWPTQLPCSQLLRQNSLMNGDTDITQVTGITRYPSAYIYIHASFYLYL